MKNPHCFIKALIAIALLSTLGNPVHAQRAPLPDFSVQEQILQEQRDRALQEQMIQQPNVNLQAQPTAPQLAPFIPGNEQPCFNINQIVLVGELAPKFQFALSAANEQQKGITDTATGRCLGTEGINIVMGRVQNRIIEKGFITTRIVASPQDLTTGTLTLTVIPGYIHEIRWKDNVETRTTWRTALPMRAGDLLNLRDIEQALETFKRVPTAEVDIQVQPADQAGQSDLVIEWKQKFPFRLNLSLDDGGSKSTGRYQGSLTFSYDNWLTLNDLFYISLNHDIDGRKTSDSHGYAIHYSVPFQGDWLLSLNASYHTYEQNVQGINQNYIYSGDSQNIDISLSRLMYRDATKRLNLSLKAWTRYSHNYIDDTEIEVQRRRTAGWELGADYRHYLGSAILNTSLTYKRGTGAHKALRAPEEATGEGTSRMGIISLNASLSVPIQLGQQRLRYYGTVRGQWNDTPLISQDQFSIGGRYTVRGFDGRSTLMGERGLLLRNDIGWVIGQTNQELYVGLDFGRVSGPSVKNQVGQNLTGAVIGLRGGYQAGPGYLSYDVFVGTPVHKPDDFTASTYSAGFNINLSF